MHDVAAKIGGVVGVLQRNQLVGLMILRTWRGVVVSSPYSRGLLI